jgi:hypothetical protein
MLRVRASRAISRRLLRSERMICSEIAIRGHWSQRYVDALFLALRREAGHCSRCADWEAMREREAETLDDFRSQGWL